MTYFRRPTISLVTPNYNGADFLEATIQSVQRQAYAELDYILVDGASTDGSIEILDRYRDSVASVIIERDDGHADAINKGFAHAHGEIMGWINSDDVLLPGCLSIVSRIFARYPEVSWITGLPSTCDEAGKLSYVGPLKRWSRLRFLSGDHLWIQQESTFWRRSLWEEAGGGLDTKLKVANDFELWARFFRHADLYSVDSMLGCFRVREGQRSVANRAVYMREVDSVLRRELSEVEPEFRARFGTLVPLVPRRLDPGSHAGLETELAQDDPPVITRKGLRDQIPLHAQTGVETRNRPRPHTVSDAAGWVSVARRNWRFLTAGLGLLTMGATMAAIMPSATIWIVLALGLGASFSMIAAMAIKTRRIAHSLLTAIEESHVSIAHSAYSRHMVELELDELSERMSR
ncbi:glycosyltransferase family 2 protein [Maricaulis sp.]|uniref:glycosyltransferase family 2 protein n=1 Tax=Maricaulis sp. TaxID=1486257 RepID=UPI00263846B1|nr:glycosyltransferase family 2 protein [Maricaulis sp.]